MNRLIIVLFYIGLSLPVLSQRNPGSKTDDHSTSMDHFISSREDITKGKSKNNHYLNTDWASFQLFLKAGCLIEGYPMKYNLLTNNFEVKFGKKIKIIPGEKVEYFEFNNDGVIHLFESVQGYHLRGELSEGFVEVIVKGDPGLLQRTALKAKKESKSSKASDTRLEQSQINYLIIDGQFKPIINDHQLLGYFMKNEATLIAEYMEKDDISIEDIRDLKRLILYIKSQQ